MSDSINSIRFDDQVIVVTGAGGGLGRAYAHLFASRGGKVVVNDLGGSPRGEGTDSRAADIVVDEIRKAGGVAVADYNSVEDGENIVQTALKNFGKIDILVNNAGILRDKSFARISDSDWDLVYKVHLRGSFLVTRAAFPHMKKNKYGRIIMTASTSGIYGNFGQANYSAAKLGLVGLSNTVAIEGHKYNINCNAIAPVSGTRLTEGILPPDLFMEMKPELIAPIILWLCHKDCQETGSLFEAAGGWFGKYRWQRTEGVMCRKSLSDFITPEDVRENWDKICDFSDAIHVESNEMDAGLLGMALEELRLQSNEGNIDVKRTSFTNTEKKEAKLRKSFYEVHGKGSLQGLTSGSLPSIIPSRTFSRLSQEGPISVVGQSIKGVKYSYESKEVILYALGVGLSTRDKDFLKFLFEGNEEFTPLPTFAIIPAQEAFMSSGFMLNLKGWSINLAKVLHGEQYIKLHKPIPVSGTLSSDVIIVDVLDKGSGAVLIADVTTKDDSNELVATSQWSIFVVGEGGFGGSRNSEKVIPLEKPPNRKPDAVHSFSTSVDQAALYRLCGDRNPLHIDPQFAMLGGFNEPILHGLCSYGVSARAVLAEFCNNDVKRFRAIKSRFAKPVVPGETLITAMWKEKSRVYFETTVKESSQVCLTGGYVDIFEDNSNKHNPQEKTVQSVNILESLSKIAFEKSSEIEKSKDVVLWVITQGGNPVAHWTFDFENHPEIIYEGFPKKNRQPLSTITLEDSTFVEVLKDGKSPQQAFMEGRLKISGIAPNFRKLFLLFPFSSKL